MAVEVAASFDVGTVERLLSELTPLTLNLGDEQSPNRTIDVDRPTLVELVAGQGLRVRTSARVRWQLKSFNVPVTISSAQVLLRLAVRMTPPFRLQLLPLVEKADLKNVPAFIEGTLIDKINQRLAELAIGWDFGTTLALRLPFPPELVPPLSFAMDAAAPRLEITAEHVRVALELPMHISR